MTRDDAGRDELLARAAGLFPGGVNSPVRAFAAVGGEPLVLAWGHGARVRDVGGTEYVDYVGGWGPAILGHAHPAVVDAIRAAAGDGFALGATGPLEIELGERIRARMPSLEMLRFVSSGTEAVMSAVRVARAATGRDLVVMFAGGYHGHSDGLLARAGSGLATASIPGSAGVPAATVASTLVVAYNAPDAIDELVATRGAEIAAILVEPVAANAGVIAPEPGVLARLREAATAAGAILVFDEVITGFRLGPGGAQERFGVRPDLTTLGKIAGGGMPIGVYGGRRDLMRLVAPSGPVYQAGTLSGHALAMAAGIATLDRLGDDAYAHLESTAVTLEAGLVGAAADAGATAAVARVGSLLTAFFRPVVPRDADEALASDRDAFGRFHRAMRDRGVFLPPSPFEAWFVSLAHGREELAITIDAARASFAAAR
jgi:glutamate-1-semialdehyde 2,1-aminomutase